MLIKFYLTFLPDEDNVEEEGHAGLFVRKLDLDFAPQVGDRLTFDETAELDGEVTSRSVDLHDKALRVFVLIEGCGPEVVRDDLLEAGWGRRGEYVRLIPDKGYLIPKASDTQSYPNI